MHSLRRVRRVEPRLLGGEGKRAGQEGCVGRLKDGLLDHLQLRPIRSVPQEGPDRMVDLLDVVLEELPPLLVGATQGDHYRTGLGLAQPLEGGLPNAPRAGRAMASQLQPVGKQDPVLLPPFVKHQLRQLESIDGRKGSVPRQRFGSDEARRVTPDSSARTNSVTNNGPSQVRPPDSKVIARGNSGVSRRDEVM